MSRDVSLLPPFIPLHEYARWAGGLLLANVAVAWVGVGIDLAELNLLLRARSGEAIEPVLRAAQFVTNQWLFAVQAALFLATAVAFVLWLFQARVNVRALGVRRPKWSRNQVVLAFLFPGVNLFRPYQVVREIWRASDPRNLDPFNWRSLPVHPVVPIWWGLLIGFLAVEALGWLTGVGAGVSLAKLQLSTGLRTVADLTAGMAAGAAYFLVTRLSEAQDRKYERQLAAEEEKPE